MDLLSSTSALFCSEDADDIASWFSDDYNPTLHHHLAADDDPIPDLIGAESAFIPSPDYHLSLDPTTRQDAVSWILKVHEFYRFRPVTACLAVNYMDRFLSSHSLPEVQGQSGKGGGWPMQLLSVACVSVAAKMEEMHVPLLLDLQILEPRFVFEPRTVRRMELLLMAALRWRMRAVTPFDFLDHLSAALRLSSATRSRAGELVLSTHRVVDFLGQRPSVIAAAAVLCAAREVADSPAVGDADLLHFLGAYVSKEMVLGCRQLMEEYLIDTCPSALGGKPCAGPPAPQSPIGVLDAAACGSCDTQKSNIEVAAQAEPSAKRRRLVESRCIASIDTGRGSESDI